LRARPGAESSVEALLRAVVEMAEQEPGTLAYAIHRSPTEPGRFVIYERYVDHAACEQHMSSLKLLEPFGRLHEMLEAPPGLSRLEELAHTRPR
jgi:quinol monooxygenase YgiN